MKQYFYLIVVASLVVPAFPVSSAPAGTTSSPYAKWTHGPPTDPGFFPIAVWLQNTKKAKQYREAGINTYVGLWKGPTDEQLSDLKAEGLKLICHLNDTARKRLDDRTLIGWMHGDEPDNAQSLGQGKGYGPPIPTGKIVADYEQLVRADPTRPVLLNLGQGVAWDRWHGRGVRTNHPEDYPEYIKGCDIASFDIYPVAHPSKEIAGNLWYVGNGVERLVKWADGKKAVWNCIECTRIQTKDKKATPHQVRSEVWMSLIHGSKGLIYFVHEWEPKFNESALLSDPEMLQAVTTINRQIQRLAPVLNEQTELAGIQVSSENKAVPIATMSRRHQGDTYIFAVGMREGNTKVTFTLPKGGDSRAVEVLDENRTLPLKGNVFEDEFKPWEVHLYRQR